jgi:hypothetical protein
VTIGRRCECGGLQQFDAVALRVDAERKHRAGGHNAVGRATELDVMGAQGGVHRCNVRARETDVVDPEVVGSPLDLPTVGWFVEAQQLQARGAEPQERVRESCR